MTAARTRLVAYGLLGLGLALPLLAVGCAGASRGSRGRLAFALSSGSRPHPRYYCADCHGVSYFDPYYDLCMRYGYRFDWRAAPEVITVYRREYVRIRRADPTVGRYRYPGGARENARKRFADAEGRMPRYEGAPADDDSKRGRGKVRRSEDTHDEREGREKRSPSRGKKERSDEKRGRGRSSP